MSKFWERLSIIIIFAFCLLAETAAVRGESALHTYLHQSSSRLGAYSISVFRNGSVLYENSQGYADLTRGEKLTSRCNFFLASITKQFTSVSLGMAQDQGRLNFHDPVSKYFYQRPFVESGMTLEHLLRHTSGLPPYRSALKMHPRPITNETVLQFLAQNPNLRFRPGDQFDYSNTGYVVAASILEKVSGKSYAEILKEKIFDPLMMTGTRVSDGDPTHIPDRAIPYYYHGALLAPVPFSAYLETYGDMGVFSSVDDLKKWTLGFQARALLSPATQTQVFSAGKFNNGNSLNYYGLGWELNQHLGQLTIEHWGLDLGTKNWVAYIPSKNIWILALSNFEDYPAEEVRNVLLNFAISAR